MYKLFLSTKQKYQELSIIPLRNKNKFYQSILSIFIYFMNLCAKLSRKTIVQQSSSQPPKDRLEQRGSQTLSKRKVDNHLF